MPVMASEASSPPAQVIAHGAGLIILSGGIQSDVALAIGRGDDAQAAAVVNRWREAFGDRYYVEVQRTGGAGEDEVMEQGDRPRCGVRIAVGRKQ